MQPSFEVAGVLEAHWLQLKHSSMCNSWQMRTLDALRRCRTASMGAHVDGCTGCGHLRISYNSCHNRHCPKCQGAEREKWIQAREQELLPVPYFHVVFTCARPAEQAVPLQAEDLVRSALYHSTRAC